MGMRANFSKIDRNGKITCTSVQWATQVDRILAEQLKAVREPEMQWIMKRVFNKITKFHHISALELLSDAKAKRAGFSDSEFSKAGTMLAVSGMREDEVKYYYDTLEDRTAGKRKLKNLNKTATEFFTNYHFQDGLSVIYDERFPNVLTFAYESEKEGNVDGVKFQRVTLENLRNGWETGYRDND